MSIRRRDRAGRPGAGTERPPLVATIQRAGQGIAVRPPCEEALRSLVTAIHVAAVHPELGFRTVTRTVPVQPQCSHRHTRLKTAPARGPGKTAPAGRRQ